MRLFNFKPHPSPAPSFGWWRRFLHVCRANPGKTAFGALALFIVLALYSADALLAGPMRNWAERTMNSQLKGYTVHIVRVRPHLWRLGLDLDSLVLVQNMHPDPPVADFGALKFSMAMAELFHFKIAGDLIIERPALHINLIQIEEEARTYVSLKNLSNHADQTRSEFHARGAFMGSGATVISGSVRSTASPADYDVHLKLDNAKLPDLNGFMMAHAGMDVADGLFSVYTEITVKEGKVDGYLKPLIRNLEIYDKQKGKGKSIVGCG